MIATAHRGLHRWGIALVRHRGSARPVDLYRYELPSPLAWAGSPGRLEVPLSKVTTSVGFSFADGGWHPHVETVRLLGDRPGTPAAETPLGRLYAAFQPRTVREAVLDDVDDPVAGLSDVPLLRGQLRELWNPFGARGEDRGSTASLDRPGLYWGPADPRHVTSEIERTMRVSDSMARDGYLDGGPAANPVTGYLLARGDDYRVVVHQGHHRLAGLAALAHDSVPVYLTPKCPPVVDEGHLARLTGDDGRYTPASAALLFSRIFESTGREKAARLGLLD